ncbi:MAG: ParB N-terminal domain-containing protein [Anaerolineae bacterium]|nr:hypothetical protein [Ardenticatenia bacterium]
MPLLPSGLELPDLRVVAGEAVFLHEEADERRVASLALRLQADGVMRNPPIVAALDGERYVVLDGANRVSALRRLGVPDLLVQVVDYHKVTLNTWYHLVTGTPTADFEQGLAAIPGLRLESATLEAARRRLAEDDCLAFVVHPDSDVTCLVGGEGLVARSAMLRDVVRLYKGRANIHRVQSDELEGLAPFYTEITGLVVFPSYQPADILAMARLDAKLPSGITRHLIPLRALRVNTELDLLWSDTLRSEKNRWLAEWTRHKLQERQIRFYEEPTVLYDE